MLLSVIVSPLVGYVAGWVFEAIFPASWRFADAWMAMPDGMSSGHRAGAEAAELELARLSGAAANGACRSLA
jgi:hypothetical protein